MATELDQQGVLRPNFADSRLVPKRHGRVGSRGRVAELVTEADTSTIDSLLHQMDLSTRWQWPVLLWFFLVRLICFSFTPPPRCRVARKTTDKPRAITGIQQNHTLFASRRHVAIDLVGGRLKTFTAFLILRIGSEWMVRHAENNRDDSLS
jgi:hypothetical protein